MPPVPARSPQDRGHVIALSVYRTTTCMVKVVLLTVYKSPSPVKIPAVTDGGSIWTQVDTSEIDLEGIVPVYLQVASNVRWHVIQWQLPVGTPLPPENELAELFGVSRDTARRALGILRTYGMIATRRGAGHYVRSRPDMQYVRVGRGSRITAAMRATRSPGAMAALSPEGRSLYSPVITVEEPGKPAAHYDSATTVISVD